MLIGNIIDALNTIRSEVYIKSITEKNETLDKIEHNLRKIIEKLEALQYEQWLNNKKQKEQKITNE